MQERRVERVARRPLRDIEPTGWRWTLRMVVFVFALLLCAIAVIALPFASHDVSYRFSERLETHSTLPETLYLPLVVAVVLIVALLWAMQGRLMRTVILAPLISVTSFITFVGVAIRHVVQHWTTANAAEGAVMAAFGLMFFVGWIIFVVEWVVVVLERKRLEASDPEFPTARVVSS